MRDVLFIYRVLLPPLALLILECVKLSEERAQVDVHPAANLDSRLFDSGSVLNSRQARLKLKGSLGLNASGVGRNMRAIFSTGQKNKEPYITDADPRWRHGVHRNTTVDKSKRETVVFRQLYHSLKNSKNDGTVELIKLNNSKDLKDSQSSAPLSLLLFGQYRGASRPVGHRGRLRRSLEDKTPKRMKLRPPQTVAPEYMIQLYRLLEGTHYNLLMNTVVTSFININEQDPDNEVSSSKFEGLAATSPSTSTTLVFDVSLPKEEEIIQYAEVRLYLARACDTPELDACETLGQINIHELDIESENSTSSLIPCKNFSIANGTWESVNVTSTVLSWATSGLKAFEVNISYHETSKTNTNIVIESLGGKDPLLVVFSKKSGHVDRTQHKVEKRDTSSSMASLESSLLQQISANQNNYSRQYFEGLLNAVMTMESDAQYVLASEDAPQILSIDKEKPSNKDRVFNNTFQSKLSDNFLHSENPLKHDTLHKMSPASESANKESAKRSFVQKTHADSEINSEKLDVTNSWDPLLVSRLRRHAKARFRRHLDVLFNDRHVEVAHSRFKRSKKKRNSCRRHELYIEFKDIKWDKSIIFPDGYQAFECIGKCYFPIGAHLSPTKHAIIQTLLHTSYPDRASRACCVPTKLEPISILYYDNSSNKSIRYDYTYDGMIAAECGCR